MDNKELNVSDLMKLFRSFVKENYQYFIVFFVLGAGFGFYQFYKAKTQFTSSFYAKSEFIPLELINNELLSFQSLVDENDFVSLSKKLIIPSDSLSGISNIEFFNVSKENKIFSLEISSSHSQDFNFHLSEAIQTYFSNNTYLKEYLEEEKEAIELEITAQKFELANLELIQKSILDQTHTTNHSYIIDPTLLSEKIATTKKTILKNEFLVDRVKAYDIIDSVTISTKPSLPKFIFTRVFIFLVLGVFLLLIYKLFKS